jgi:ATP-dependent DNA ligase
MSILDKINDLSVSAEDATTFPIIYKYTATGQAQQWQIFVDGDSFYTEEGIVGGVITRSKPTKCLPKNVGKLNATTPAQQAIAEARAKHQKKLDKHYNEVLTEERSFYEPMLAHSVKDYSNLLFTVRTFIQPKYDGVRAISRNGELTSRGGKYWVACPHLLQNDVVLDGELYNHKFKDDFDSLISLFRKQKPKPEDIEKSAELGEMWVYDFPGHPGVFSERYAALEDWYNNANTNPMIKLVPTHEIKNQEELEYWHNEFYDAGYEGSIVRLDLFPYEHKRSKQVLKYKVFVDEEFEVVDIIEGIGNKVGLTGKVMLKLPDGRTFKSNMIGTHAYSADILANKHEYIGKMATVKFQNYTPKGLPRCPEVKHFDRASYE